jgi:predicted anti-sigma-YlaC factor YlaD
MTHLTFEQINDIADGRPTADRDSQHVAECAECRGTLLKVRELMSAAHALPRDIAPPPEVWTALQSRVGRKPARARSISRWAYGGWIAAAAVLVLVAGMTLLPSGQNQKAKATKLAPPAPSPVLLLAVERSYAETVAQLRQTLETQRSTLSPATIRVLERSLATIDAAIAEARAALADDPANQALVDILSANYKHKVELLQRATELSSSS